MTICELSQLYYLKREIEMDRRRLEELEAMLLPKGTSIDGMPRMSRCERTAERYIDEIEKLRKTIAEKQTLCIRERRRLERYIASVEDSLMRQILTRRFVDGCAWKRIATEVGGGNTPDSMRKACMRYLHKR